VNGVENRLTDQRNSRIGATGAMPIINHQSLKLSYNGGTYIRYGGSYHNVSVHSYMKYLYKYPQREFPYRDLVETNRGRSREESEYELLDTGAFHEDRYFDVFVGRGRSKAFTAPGGAGRH
jgi:hypothetical protein